MNISSSIPKQLIVKPSSIVRRLYPKALWKVKTETKKIYLTFDDGPIPEVTPWVLDTLKTYNAQATFFCIGDNVQKNPDIFKAIQNAGHSIGNHTFNHWNGWKTNNSDYFENIALCTDTLHAQVYSEEKANMLFRPPYGSLRLSQYNRLKQNYQIVFWDVLSMDYDLNVSEETVLQNVLKHSDCGSIIVFHDSLKAEKNLRYALPKVLDYFSAKGFTFAAL